MWIVTDADYSGWLSIDAVFPTQGLAEAWLGTYGAPTNRIDKFRVHTKIE